MAWERAAVRILVLQETDWTDRNPILHHRMLEALTLVGHEVCVVDYDISWHQRGWRPLFRRRQVMTGVHKFFPEASVPVVRPAMVRLPGIARVSWLASNAAELRRFARWNPDVVVAYGISNAWLGRRWARRRGIRFVYHLLDALHTLAEPPYLARAARPLERAVLRSADAVIAVNNALAAYAVEMGADPERVVTIPMGVHGYSREEVEDIHRRHSSAMRAQLGVDDDDVVLLFVGWLYTFSGLRELAAALAREPADSRLKLLVVGDGDLLTELEQLRSGGALRDRLLLTGRRPASQMPMYLAASDICLLPAHRNATMEHIVPAKVVEYMEHGKPVLVTRLRGITAEFGDLPGLLYLDGPDDVLDVARAFVESADDPRGRARALGEHCRALMATRDDWDTVTAEFERVLQRAGARQGTAVAPGSTGELHES